MDFPEFVLLRRRGDTQPSLLAFGLEQGADGAVSAPAFAVPRPRDKPWRKGSVFYMFTSDNTKLKGKLKLAETLKAPDKLVRFETIRFENPDL